MNIFVTITVILLLSRILVILSVVHYCLINHTKVCIPCEKNQDNETYCKKMTDRMKIVHFENSTNIDYVSFINTSIKIVDEPKKVTLYTCPPHVTYLQVNPYNFYPLREKLLLPTYIIKRKPMTNNSKFQSCLETYCLDINDNKFVCHVNSMNNFNFQFNSVVSAKVQRIQGMMDIFEVRRATNPERVFQI